MTMTAGDGAPAAVRLTFTYDGDSVRLAEAIVVAMTPPPSDPVDGYQGQTGFWLEVHDPPGKTIYRQIFHDPMPSYREVHAQPGNPSTHGAISEPSGIFQAVIPVPPQGSVIVLFGAPQPAPIPIGDVPQERSRNDGPRVGTDPAAEIARFDLDKALGR
jgi:hypothetical protein